MNNKMKYRAFALVFVLFFIFISSQAAISAGTGGGAGAGGGAGGGGSSGGGNDQYKEAQKEENGNLGLTPPGMPHEYVSKDKQMKDKDPAGSGFSVSCDQAIIDQKTGLAPISSAGVCEDIKRSMQFGVTAGEDGKPRPMVMKLEKDFNESTSSSSSSSSGASSGSSSSSGGTKSGEQQTGYKVDETAGPKSWGEQYKQVRENADNIILKWKDYPGLVPKVAGGTSGSTTTGGTGSTTKKEETTTYFSEGADKGNATAYFSTKFKSNEEVAEAGACQMVMVPDDPKFYVKRIYPPKRVFENPETGEKKVLDYKEDEAPEGYVFRYYKNYELSESGEENAMPVQFERVVNPEHPFAPRNDDYEDRISSGICHVGSDITKICGTDTKDEIGGMRAWEPMGGSNSNYGDMKSGTKQFQNGKDKDGKPKMQQMQQISFKNSQTGSSQGMPGAQDFSYYKKLIEDIGQSTNGGDSKLDLITTTPTMLGIFDATHDACYAACYAATYGADEQLCCDVCEYATCQMFILPPVQMDNYLKYAYSNFDYLKDGGVQVQGNKMEPGLPSVTVDARKGADSEKDGMDSKWSEGYKSESLSYYLSEPKKGFEYKAPFIKHWPTGEPATKQFLEYKKTVSPGADYEKEDSSIDREKWEPWRDVVIGVSPYVLPDESNITEKGVFNMAAQAGSWTELKEYQANCISKYGLNCICDVSNFENANQTGYIEGSDSTIPLEISNESKVTSVPVEYTDPKTGETFKSLKAVRNKQDTVSVGNPKRVLVGKYLYPAMPGVKGKMTPDGGETDEYPGPSTCQSSPETGLDSARIGDIIRLKSEATSESVDKRKPIIAKVEAVYPAAKTDDDGKWVSNTDSENKCILISQGGTGAVSDSFGNTENSGRKTQRWLCKNKSTSSGFSLEGILGGGLFGGSSSSSGSSSGGGSGEELPSCATPYYEKCYEESWNDYVVTRTKTDEQPDGSYGCKDTTPRINYENLIDNLK